MSTTQRVLHTDSDNHKVVLHSEIVNKRLIRQFVTYDRYDAEYEYLTSFHAACLILLGVELERCYIPEISVRMFKKAHAALRNRNRRLRIMRYLRARHPKLFQQFASEYRQRVSGIRDAFNPQGRVEIEIAGEEQIHQGSVLNRSIVCRSCLIGSISLSHLLVGGEVTLNPAEDELSGWLEPTHIFEAVSFWLARFHGKVDFGGARFHAEANFGGTEFDGEASFSDVGFHGEASFCAATFHREAYFSDAAFENGVSFYTPFAEEGATFHSWVYFLHATFCNEADFTRVTFSDYAYFQKTTFNGYAKFLAVTFNGKADFWSSAFNGNANFEGAAFNTEADFRSTIFSGDAKFSVATFNGKADFYEATFNGYVDFNGARFGAGTDCRSATFGSDAHFMGATFSGEALFWGATFSGIARFVRATFSAGANFGSAKFTSDTDLREAAFNDEASFFGATFSNKALFLGATFSGKADFGFAAFLGPASFTEATFNGYARFWGAAFSGVANFDKAIFSTVNFSDARFEKNCSVRLVAAASLVFSNAVFTENLLLSTHQDLQEWRDRMLLQRSEERFKLIKEIEGKHKRGLGTVNFEDTLVQGELRCDFKYLVPRKRGFCKWEPVVMPHRIAEGFDEPEEGWKRQDYWEEAQKQYAWLKEQYRKQGRYEDEDNAHWWASECARKGRKAVAGGSWLWRPLALIAVWWFLLCKAVWRNARSAVVRRFLRFGLAKFKKDQIQPWRETSLVAFIEAGVVIAFAIAVGTNGVVFGLVPLVLLVVASFLAAFPRLGALVLYRWVFGYGVRPRNVVLTALIVIFVCGVLFSAADAAGLLQPLHTEKDKRPFGTGAASSIMTGFYFSVITFATVGYGDVSATGWAAGLAMVEGLLGVVLNAALIVVIFRKLIR